MVEIAGVAEDSAKTDESENLWKWQFALKPAIVLIVLATSIFFFATTYLEFTAIEASILKVSPTSVLDATLAKYEKANGVQTFDYVRWKSETLAESSASDSRATQSRVTLLVNVWTRYLGFVTGMVLAINGAAFIMARLSEGAITLSASNGGISGSLSTSSPGIVLTVLGTMLMLAAMTIRFSQSSHVEHQPTSSANTPASAAAPLIAPIAYDPGNPDDPAGKDAAPAK